MEPVASRNAAERLALARLFARCRLASSRKEP